MERNEQFHYSRTNRSVPVVALGHAQHSGTAQRAAPGSSPERRRHPRCRPVGLPRRPLGAHLGGRRARQGRASARCTGVTRARRTCYANWPATAWPATPPNSRPLSRTTGIPGSSTPTASPGSLTAGARPSPSASPGRSRQRRNCPRSRSGPARWPTRCTGRHSATRYYATTWNRSTSSSSWRCSARSPCPAPTAVTPCGTATSRCSCRRCARPAPARSQRPRPGRAHRQVEPPPIAVGCWRLRGFLWRDQYGAAGVCRQYVGDAAKQRGPDWVPAALATDDEAGGDLVCDREDRPGRAFRGLRGHG